MYVEGFVCLLTSDWDDTDYMEIKDEVCGFLCNMNVLFYLCLSERYSVSDILKEWKKTWST